MEPSLWGCLKSMKQHRNSKHTEVIMDRQFNIKWRGEVLSWLPPLPISPSLGYIDAPLEITQFWIIFQNRSFCWKVLLFLFSEFLNFLFWCLNDSIWFFLAPFRSIMDVTGTSQMRGVSQLSRISIRRRI